MRLLVVEDEKTLLGVISRRLKQEGYSVDSASDGAEALAYIKMSEYDCIILDIMLPKVDGLSIVRQMRSLGNASSVLLLTAKDSIEDRVIGLDAGADDYLVKPFSYDELSARVRVMLRRHTDNKSTVLKCNDLSMDTLSRQVKRGEKLIDLSAKEYALLEYFLRNSNRVLTRSQITEHVWNFDFDSESNVVDVYVRYLRRKIDADFEQKLIQTVRGIGYTLKEYR